MLKFTKSNTFLHQLLSVDFFIIILVREGTQLSLNFLCVLASLHHNIAGGYHSISNFHRLSFFITYFYQFCCGNGANLSSRSDVQTVVVSFYVIICTNHSLIGTYIGSFPI